MQDIYNSIGGGRFFTGSGGGGGGGDRRLRTVHQNLQQLPPVPKCPRCDSANTKFCYYNNYNLSQPRHFCKSCRRYWTKGGVLRNVPVGGGCRKTKRSKQKPNSTATMAEKTTITNLNSHSSSESSSLTATNTTAEAVSNSEPKLANPSPAAANSVSDCGLFSEIGSLTNLMAASSSAANSGGSALPFEFGSISTQFRLNQNLIGQSWNMNNQKEVNLGRENDDHQIKAQESLMIDQTAQVDLLERSNGGGGFGSLGDWQQCGDQGLFDLTSNVEQQYWSQNQWNDQDNRNLYLP